jgi:hypothetical protein
MLATSARQDGRYSEDRDLGGDVAEISYDDLASGVDPTASPEPAAPAAEPSLSPEPAPAAQPEPDLDELLRSFDEQTGWQQQQQPQIDFEAAHRYSEWEAQQAREHAALVEQQARAEIDRKDALQLIDELRADLPVQPQMIGYWLDGQLQANPQLMEIWQNRTTDPQSYQRARHYLGRELHKLVAKMPDPEATEVKAIVSHAVRGASTQVEIVEPAPDFGSMSDAELRDYTRKNFNFV